MGLKDTETAPKEEEKILSGKPTPVLQQTSSHQVSSIPLNKLEKKPVKSALRVTDQDNVSQMSARITSRNAMSRAETDLPNASD